MSLEETTSGGAVRPGILLNALVRVLDRQVREVMLPAADEQQGGTQDAPSVASVAIVDAGDFGAGHDGNDRGDDHLPQVDLLIAVAVPGRALTGWLSSHVSRPRLPVAVMLKENVATPELSSAAVGAGVAVVVVDQRARWDVVHARVRRALDERQYLAGAPETTGAPVSTLSELVLLIAEGTGGMVTIEDAHNRVLAYSPSGSTADAMRTQAILGRNAPAGSMEMFARHGVVDTIRSGPGIAQVPPDEEMGMRGRLVTGIHGPGGETIGSIWVQPGADGFAPDSETVLRGAAVSAAALMLRPPGARAPEDMVLTRLLGEDGGVDVATARTLLSLPDAGPHAVIGCGLAVQEDAGNGVGGAAGSGAGTAAGSDQGARAAELARKLQIHVHAFAPQGRVAVIGARVYVLLPHIPEGTDERLQSWVAGLLQRFDRSEGAGFHRVRAAIACPVESLADVADARGEVDRVLDSAVTHQCRVTTLAQSRTSVLLGEVMDLLVSRADTDDLQDPRLRAVVDYDAAHDSELVETLRAYLRAGMNVTEAAAALNVHQNTLRYRVDRAQRISGLDLSDPGDRLLTTIQLEGGLVG